MPKHTKLSELFEEVPDQWGLRGDPHLWHEIKSMVDDRETPQNEDEFSRLLEGLYRQLVGVPMTQMEPVFVERYSHGGMSSGYVLPKFWQERALPLLLERFRALHQD